MMKHDYAAAIAASPFAAKLEERLVRYAKVWTTSDSHSQTVPSTERQWALAKELAEELRSIGVPEVKLDGKGFIVARLPAPTKELAALPPLGFMAHMDTASDVSGENVRPMILRDWDGSPIPRAGGYPLGVADSAPLAGHVGDTIICSDGSTLLGADDKAGIAEIMTAVEWLVANPALPRPPLEIYFTPDEETGKGMDSFPLPEARAKACYTLDGELLGEYEAECFNAYKAKVRFEGKPVHIGKARGKLANAVSMAAVFITMLPRSESPEATDERYGYWCPLEVKGGLESAELEVYLRDFDAAGMERRLAALELFARAVEAQHPGGKVRVEAEKQYENMLEALARSPLVLERLERAIAEVGLEPVRKPIRGGTDGARLTAMGVPTPNIWTGGFEYHSKNEWASLFAMVKAAEVVVKLCGLWASR